MGKLNLPARVFVSEFDGTTVCASDHTGIAASAPDPLCREHYKGGPIGGNYFAPCADVEVQKAIAARIALTWNADEALVDACCELAQTLADLNLKDVEAQTSRSEYDLYGLERRAREALKLAGVVL